jgi:catechol 2,3-dioxygenase-like lactoylglutathione lyase family enzyme
MRAFCARIIAQEVVMLARVDRVQLAVADSQAAARTFREVLDALPVREAPSAYLGASRRVLAMGSSEVELCEPSGPGPAAEHLRSQGEGLMTAGFSTRDMAALKCNLERHGCRFTPEGEQVYLEPSQTLGMRVVLSPDAARPPTGLVSHLYEVTNTLVSDWRAAADRYTRIFGLDQSRFSPIKSEHFGYVGTLTLFDPTDRLDRIEISQVTDPKAAMGRWVAKRGDSLYMCYVEADDVRPIIERLTARGARFTARGPDPKTERDGLWVHPSALCGLLLGISRTTVGWEWSGQPARVERP